MDQKPLAQLRVPFSISVAVYTIIAIFLGWEDRTPSNIMVQMDTGTLFHIDFEYMFEQQPPVKGLLMWLLDGRQNRKISSSSTSTNTSATAHNSNRQAPIHIDSTHESVELKFTPELCANIENMLGGAESSFYKEVFVKRHCNKVFNYMYTIRPLLFYCTRVMAQVPSNIHCTQSEHRLFFKNFASVAAGLKGDGCNVEALTLVSSNEDFHVQSLFNAVHVMYQAMNQ